MCTNKQEMVPPLAEVALLRTLADAFYLHVMLYWETKVAGAYARVKLT